MLFAAASALAGPFSLWSQNSMRAAEYSKADATMALAPSMELGALSNHRRRATLGCYTSPMSAGASSSEFGMKSRCIANWPPPSRLPNRFLISICSPAGRLAAATVRLARSRPSSSANQKCAEGFFKEYLKYVSKTQKQLVSSPGALNYCGNYYVV